MTIFVATASIRAEGGGGTAKDRGTASKASVPHNIANKNNPVPDGNEELNGWECEES